MKDLFAIDNEQAREEHKQAYAKTVLNSWTFKDNNHETEPLKFKSATCLDEAHTLAELIHFAEKNDKVSIEGGFLHLFDKGIKRRFLNKTAIVEALKGPKKTNHIQAIRESFSDSFATDDDFSVNSGLIGDDYVPLLGGPFNKNLPYYDYLRMHALGFHAFHHDPLAKRIINVIRDFTLGRGWRADTAGKDKDEALSVWRAFEEVNDLYSLMNFAIIELCTYGEIMLWELPNNQTKIQYDVTSTQKAPAGILPRFRLVDPSTVWEIVTYPEDITRVLYYQQIYPTQFQIYSGTDGGDPVPTSKFIVNQILASEMLHFKVNCVSNEKRGRTILYPILGYLKRLRDSVNYSIISDQKNAAWSIDTTIEGAQRDIDQYISDQMSAGTIPPAGSEFVHTDKIKREYLANQAPAGRGSPSFEWCMSMIAAGSGVPVSYFGTHLSGGQTRGSAIVATEPVAKMFEHFQFILEQVMKRMAKRLFKKLDLDAEIEVTFPEIITQDRSQKLKDLNLAQLSGWISRERAATVAAKELGFTDYEYENERIKIDQETETDPSLSAPLTTPGGDGTSSEEAPQATSAVTSQDRRDIKKQDRGEGGG